MEGKKPQGTRGNPKEPVPFCSGCTLQVNMELAQILPFIWEVSAALQKRMDNLPPRIDHAGCPFNMLLGQVQKVEHFASASLWWVETGLNRASDQISGTSKKPQARLNKLLFCWLKEKLRLLAGQGISWDDHKPCNLWLLGVTKERRLWKELTDE